MYNATVTKIVLMLLLVNVLNLQEENISVKIQVFLILVSNLKKITFGLLLGVLL